MHVQFQFILQSMITKNVTSYWQPVHLYLLQDDELRIVQWILEG